MDTQLHKQQMYNVIGAAMAVYNEIGYGFSELIYQECLSIVCTEKGIPWEREKPLKMMFHGIELEKLYKEGHLGNMTKYIQELKFFYNCVEEEIKRRKLKKNK